MGGEQGDGTDDWIGDRGQGMVQEHLQGPVASQRSLPLAEAGMLGRTSFLGQRMTGRGGFWEGSELGTPVSHHHAVTPVSRPVIMLGR